MDLNGIKHYKTNTYTLETIAKVVPHLIADLFKTSFIVKNNTQIGYDWGRLIEFQINLGTAILNKKFDYLDNITIQFLNGYNCILFPKQCYVKFSQDEINNFIKICNKFKDLEWDDIISEYIDATYNLFCSGKFFENGIIGI